MVVTIAGALSLADNPPEHKHQGFGGAKSIVLSLSYY
jgi:hypothetical protein